jgi:hypothetical protein
MDEQEFRSILFDYEKMNDAARKEIAALREAIRHWAVGPHAQRCTTRADCPCDCGASDEFEARLTARHLVGLEDNEL